jgi:RND family efflux transporter MFP subunit
MKPKLTGATVAVLSAGLLVAAGISGCQKTVAQAPPPKPPEVFVDHPVTRTVTDFEEATGRLAPVKLVEVRARVSGYLDAVQFKDGDDVQEGAPLFQIDARPYTAALAEAEANVKQLESRYENNRRQEERLIGLAEKKFTTEEQLDQARFARKETEAELQAARAAADIARLNLEFTQIKSPISGRISRRLVDPGNLVKADETSLVTIVSLDPIYAYFDIDERTVLQFRRMIAAGKVISAEEQAIPIELALADEEEFTIPGSVNFVDNMLSPTTGTLRLRADVENPQKLLAPGMFVRIKVPIGEPHPAVLIQEEALGSDQGQKFVYVLDEENKVEYRRIKAGRLYSGMRVVEAGLTPEDRVIVKGLQRVRPGIQVDPQPLPAAPAPQQVAAEKTDELVAQ